MIIKLTLRMLKEIDIRLLLKFIWNFVIKGMVTISRFKRRSEKGSAFPAFLMLSITNRCNLQCQGCWVSTSKPFKELSFQLLNNVIIEAKKNGSYFFGILGGEPLMHPDILEVIKSHPDCYFQVFTNGILLTPDAAERLKRLGNVTPVISIEGTEIISDQRRGGINVFENSLAGIKNCVKNRLITGVATSVCKSNFTDLVSKNFVNSLVRLGVHYLWYYIYRPVGERPAKELVLSEREIIALRRFIVKIRGRVPIAVIDTYWDHKGKALCPAATGISHHINPEGFIEFCPPIQFARDNIRQGDDLKALFLNSDFLNKFRVIASEQSRGCILMENPQSLLGFLQEHKAVDTSGRDCGFQEITTMDICPCHNIPGKEIPETNWAYKFAKKNWFFGFGAYG